MTDGVTQSQPMSCPVKSTNMPAATDAFANTYLFLVTVRFSVFLLPFYMVALCCFTSYNLRCFLKKTKKKKQLTDNVHFSFFTSSAIICNTVMTYATDT